MLKRRWFASIGMQSGAAPVTPWYQAGGAPEPIASFLAIGAESLAASKVNLANPATHALEVPGASPTWTATDGWIADAASSQYFRIDLTPSQVGTVIMRFSDVANFNDKYLFGTGSDPIWGPIHRSNTELWFGIGGQYLFPTQADNTSGVVAIAGNNAFFNKTKYGPVVGANLTGASLIRIFAWDTVIITAHGQAIAFYTEVLTDAQIEAVTDAMAALTGP